MTIKTHINPESILDKSIPSSKLEGAEPMVSVTSSELDQLIGDGALSSGTVYRVTDFHYHDYEHSNDLNPVIGDHIHVPEKFFDVCIRATGSSSMDWNNAFGGIPYYYGGPTQSLELKIATQKYKKIDSLYVCKPYTCPSGTWIQDGGKFWFKLELPSQNRDEYTSDIDYFLFSGSISSDRTTKDTDARIHHTNGTVDTGVTLYVQLRMTSGGYGSGGSQTTYLVGINSLANVYTSTGETSGDEMIYSCPDTTLLSDTVRAYSDLDKFIEYGCQITGFDPDSGIYDADYIGLDKDTMELESPIYIKWMRDSCGNEAPYDFKTMKFSILDDYKGVHHMHIGGDLGIYSFFYVNEQQDSGHEPENWNDNIPGHKPYGSTELYYTLDTVDDESGLAPVWRIFDSYDNTSGSEAVTFGGMMLSEVSPDIDWMGEKIYIPKFTVDSTDPNALSMQFPFTPGKIYATNLGFTGSRSIDGSDIVPEQNSFLVGVKFDYITEEVYPDADHRSSDSERTVSYKAWFYAIPNDRSFAENIQNGEVPEQYADQCIPIPFGMRLDKLVRSNFYGPGEDAYNKFIISESYYTPGEYTVKYKNLELSESPWYVGPNTMFSLPLPIIYISTVTDPVYFYTFSDPSAVEDASLTAESRCANNILKSSNIVFRMNDYDSSIRDNFVDEESPCNYFWGSTVGNKLGKEVIGNTFLDQCIGNEFGDRFKNNVVWQYCCFNKFGVDCNNNSIRQNFQRNDVGHMFKNNTIMNETYDNKFGYNMHGNNIWYNCEKNTIGANFALATIKNNFKDNTIGNDVGTGFRPTAPKFGNDCQNNTVCSTCDYLEMGDSCFDNFIEAECSSVKFGEYCLNNHVFAHCQGIDAGTDAVTGDKNPINCMIDCLVYPSCKVSIDSTAAESIDLEHRLKNYRFETTVENFEPTHLGASYLVTVAKNSSDDTVEFCVADLVSQQL